MPIYEYLCDSPAGCGKRFDGYAPMAESSQPRRCACGVEARKIISAVRGFGDFPGYVSPASGKWVEGRRARLEDFRRTGTRAYEAGERADFERRQQLLVAQEEAQADVAIEQTLEEITH